MGEPSPVSPLAIGTFKFPIAAFRFYSLNKDYVIISEKSLSMLNPGVFKFDVLLRYTVILTGYYYYRFAMNGMEFLMLKSVSLLLN